MGEKERDWLCKTEWKCCLSWGPAAFCCASVSLGAERTASLLLVGHVNFFHWANHRYTCVHIQTLMLTHTHNYSCTIRKQVSGLVPVCFPAGGFFFVWLYHYCMLTQYSQTFLFMFQCYYWEVMCFMCFSRLENLTYSLKYAQSQTSSKFLG